MAIGKYYAGGKITEVEERKMEMIITNTYFDLFRGSWALSK
jgi:hypothetical protein